MGFFSLDAEPMIVLQIWPGHGCCNNWLVNNTGALCLYTQSRNLPSRKSRDIPGLPARPCPQPWEFTQRNQWLLAHQGPSWLLPPWPPSLPHQDVASDISIKDACFRDLVDFPMSTFYHEGQFLKGIQRGHETNRENCFFLPFWMWVMVETFSWSVCGDRVSVERI